MLVWFILVFLLGLFCGYRKSIGMHPAYVGLMGLICAARPYLWSRGLISQEFAGLKTIWLDPVVSLFCFSYLLALAFRHLLRRRVQMTNLDVARQSKEQKLKQEIPHDP
jgi:hypothetical protein